jgi:hypothetical protein
MASFLDPLLGGMSGGRRLLNARTGRLVAHSLSTAFDSTSRRTGLLRHDALAEGSALIIAPTSAIHTFFMRFPIDVAFVARTGRILKVRRDLPPWRIAAAWRGYAVVELPAGTLARSETGPDDTVVVV